MISSLQSAKRTIQSRLRSSRSSIIPPPFNVVRCIGSTNEQAASEEDLFRYSAQRWLWNEPEQLQRRYRRFDLKALIQVAEDAYGPNAGCVNLTKLPEGNFNKIFLLTMKDGGEVVVRLPNPNAGQAYYITASEVATMDYVRERLQIPAPKILAYGAEAKSNSVGAEYIIMEKCPGIELGHLWDDLPPRTRIDVVQQLASFTARLFQAQFPYYGSLYYTKDVPNMRKLKLDDTFSVGLTTSRSWFDDKRGEVQVDRGPWTSAEQLMTAILDREVVCLKKFKKFPRDRQQGIYNGPGGYRPSKDSKLAVIKEVARVLPHILPYENTYTTSTLWHNDLHSYNIFVDKDCPTNITGIIDWQGVNLGPAFLQVHFPALIDYDGPLLDGFEKPKLPSNFKELESIERKAAKDLDIAQSIYGLYRIFTQKQAPYLLRTLRYRDTLSCQVLALIGSIFDDGEAYIQTLLARIAEEETWKKISRKHSPCPLIYSDEESAEQIKNMARWERDIELKAHVIDEVGAYTGWDGAVSPEDFESVGERLEKARENFLRKNSTTPEEMQQWMAAWPFKNS